MRLMVPPPPRPNCASATDDSTRNSCDRIDGRKDQDAEPVVIFGVANAIDQVIVFFEPRAIHGDPVTPRFIVMGLPVVCVCAGITPARECSNWAKFRLFNGKSWIAFSDRRLDSVLISVCSTRCRIDYSTSCVIVPIVSSSPPAAR